MQKRRKKLKNKKLIEKSGLIKALSMFIILLSYLANLATIDVASQCFT